ncbi:hypothetical protein [Natronococcus sp. A-GB7]|uniref:hypothetical protein n=1 Tax=Natronococcus sp. A-GB7 TaxID=3037649 RepID=UPI00241D5948|nr:hypothetical protein [Natronococcus sp. A-GB7]MDG5820360.1 hypothetical protein [Natronococcus sp. A-GB7]
MGLERFVRWNLVLVPALLLAGYLFIDYLPLIALPLGVAYITFATLICVVWALSVVSLKIRP